MKSLRATAEAFLCSYHKEDKKYGCHYETGRGPR